VLLQHLLDVEILRLEPLNWGWTGIIPGLGLLAEDFTQPYIGHFDRTNRFTAPLRDDIHIPIQPFCGTMGVATMHVDSDLRGARLLCDSLAPARLEDTVTRTLVAGFLILSATGAMLVAQGGARPMSPDGTAQVQVLGKWVKGERPTFALGRESYVGGKWIEITYGRPLQRGRDLFGSGESYGKALLDVGAPGFPPPPVWRAGANVSTRLKSEVALAFGDKTVPAGEYSLLIDLKPAVWTLIVSSWPAQQKFDPQNKTALWGAYGYTPDKDVARIPMKPESLPFAVEELTWSFLDMASDRGRVAVLWGKTMASASFIVAPPR